MVLLCTVAGAARGKAPVNTARIVFAGDSITDGHTYPLLIAQALREAGRPVPVCINAGIGGDTSAGLLKRVDRDILAHRPTLVTLMIGVNDVLRGVTLQEYSAHVTAIADRLDKAQIPLVIFTTTILGPKFAEQERILDTYNDFLRTLAKERGYPVAEINQRMKDARAAGITVLESDEVHQNFVSYRLITRVVLNTLGSQDVPVPEALTLSLMPGVITHWRMRIVPEGHELDAATARALVPDAAWTAYTLPDQQPSQSWWSECERQRGYAQMLEAVLGPAKRYYGVTTVTERAARTAYLNTGGHMQAVWLNGTKVFQSTEWTGWHAGKERIPVQLVQGDNTLIIETGSAFFVSLTDTNTW